ncbi:hypothetical protein [Stenotrophomonas indicatrix]|uniref:hypothetical protein n=1 Tax=Stenotrophomonas indicatrix TaxID=2045451 RepID=UPI001CBE6734|nr:hypothetical protein [Stenotrophomonas indicatrix]
MIRIAMFGLLLVTSSGMAADLTTVFGLQLGSNFDIPECSKQGITYQKPLAGSCQGAFSTSDSEGSYDGAVRVERAVVIFAEGEQPAIVVGNLLATTLDGNLVSIEFPTAGPVAAPFVMDALREKLGRESKAEKYQLTNRLGISTEHLSAQWNLNSVHVSYMELLPGARVGRVEIDNPSGLVHRRSKEVHPKDQGTKL